MAIMVEELRNMDFSDVKDKGRLKPTHPGIILKKIINELGISEYRLAKEISVPARRINEIIHGKRSITADTAVRLSRAFNTTVRFWLNLQSAYDAEIAERRLSKILSDIPLLAATA